VRGDEHDASFSRKGQTSPRPSLTGSQSSGYLREQQQQQQATQSSSQYQNQQQGGGGVQTTVPESGLNRNVLIGLVVAFVVLLLLQFSQHRAVAHQLKGLSAQMAASQKASEAHMASQSDVIERLLKHLAKK
jgi:cytochrome c-type biogenesis protein CcmH/NrfG